MLSLLQTESLKTKLKMSRLMEYNQGWMKHPCEWAGREQAVERDPGHCELCMKLRLEKMNLYLPLLRSYKGSQNCDLKILLQYSGVFYNPSIAESFGPRDSENTRETVLTCGQKAVEQKMLAECGIWSQKFPLWITETSTLPSWDQQKKKPSKGL